MLNHPVSRRHFFYGALLAGAVPAGVGRAQPQRPDPAKLARISIMSLCFNRVIRNPARPDDATRTLDILDFPQMVADRYGVHLVELQHSHFASTEPEYLREYRNRLDKAGSKMHQINLEFGQLSASANLVQRLEAIDLTKAWVDHAVILGCPRIMPNPGSIAPEVRQTAIEALRTMNAYAKTRNVFITMENRDDGTGGTPSRYPSWDVEAEVIKAAGIWSNPDVGNFPDEQKRAAGLPVLFPLSSGGSHWHYNPQEYNEAAAVNVAKAAGYKGVFSIEAENYNGPDPYVAVQTILDELLKDM